MIKAWSLQILKPSGSKAFKTENPKKLAMSNQADETTALNALKTTKEFHIKKNWVVDDLAETLGQIHQHG